MVLQKVGSEYLGEFLGLTEFADISQLFADTSQLAEMSQHLKNTACGCCVGQGKIV